MSTGFIIFVWILSLVLAYCVGRMTGLRRGFRIGTDVDINPWTLKITRPEEETK